MAKTSHFRYSNEHKVLNTKFCGPVFLMVGTRLWWTTRGKAGPEPALDGARRALARACTGCVWPPRRARTPVWRAPDRNRTRRCLLTPPNQRQQHARLSNHVTLRERMHARTLTLILWTENQSFQRLIYSTAVSVLYFFLYLFLYYSTGTVL